MAVGETRYAKSGEVHIAYRVVGDGPFDLVVVPPLFFSIDLHAVEPHAAAAFERLGQFARVIIFDKRGTGSSDRITGAPTLEERMDDVRAVMEATGSDCAAILGAADGAAMSLLFAATYPERVFALAVFRAKPRYVWAPDYTWAPTREQYERETTEYMADWGRPEKVLQRAAIWGREASEDEVRESARLLRLVFSPGAVIALRRVNMEIDVRAVLPAIHVPVLLMHRPHDAPDARETGDVQAAAYMAERLPHAEVVEIPRLTPWFDSVLPPLERFLPEAWAERERVQREPRRVLATVLFTDLVGSTPKAVELGPEWRRLLAAHNAAVRRELARFAGREIDTSGDGFFASGFDGPARAIRCASAIRDAVRALGLGIRIGVHTGECDLVDRKLSGLAVVVGSRVAALAKDGDVLVSGTVRDLVAGSGIQFEARGVHELKGLGEWPIFAVTST